MWTSPVDKSGRAFVGRLLLQKGAKVSKMEKTSLFLSDLSRSMPNFADYDALMSESDDLFAAEAARPQPRGCQRRTPSPRPSPRQPSYQTPYQRASQTAAVKPASATNVIPVSTAILRMQGMLGNMFAGLWITGEVSEISRPPSGHVYFTLKEGEAQIACVYFRGQAQRHPADFRVGDRIEISAVPDIYPKSGRLQLRLNDWRHAGMGELYEAYLRLKKKLADEGLFRAESKQALPRFIRRAAVVTSAQAAALQDVVRTVKRRTPWIRLTLVPALVQGERAPETLSRALRRADGLEVDAVLLVRGGGSFEDLNGFNDEGLVRTIAAMRHPVIAGIGHETDETLATLAADVGTSTPTAAAEHLGEEKDAWLERIDDLADELVEALDRYLSNRDQALDEASLMLNDRLTLTLERKAADLSADSARLALLSRSALKEAELSLRNVNVARAAELALREKAARLDWCARALTAPALLDRREADLGRAGNDLSRAITEKLRREEERVFYASRTFRSPDEALRAHTERMARAALGLKLRADEKWQAASADADRAAGRFLPIAGREVARKERDLIRAERHLPDPKRWLDALERRLTLTGRTLAAADPKRPLTFGYALVTKAGEPVVRAAELRAGERIELTFADNKREADIV